MHFGLLYFSTQLWWGALTRHFWVPPFLLYILVQYRPLNAPICPLLSSSGTPRTTTLLARSALASSSEYMSSSFLFSLDMSSANPAPTEFNLFAAFSLSQGRTPFGWGEGRGSGWFKQSTLVGVTGVGRRGKRTDGKPHGPPRRKSWIQVWCGAWHTISVDRLPPAYGDHNLYMEFCSQLKLTAFIVVNFPESTGNFVNLMYVVTVISIALYFFGITFYKNNICVKG